MQKIFNIFFAAVASILFCKNLEINVLTLSPWSVIIWSFKPRVSRNLKLQCRHFFGFNPLCNLTWPSKIEHVLILFWQWLHFLGFSPLCNFRWHPKMQKIFSIFLQQFHLFSFVRILALMFWLFHCGVLSDDLSNHVYLEIWFCYVGISLDFIHLVIWHDLLKCNLS